MNKTIIAVYGRASEGKSSTIKNILTILKQYRFAKIEILKEDGDVLAIVELNGVKIGIESQGDPKSRMISEETIELLISKGCEIIVCATRTEGMTVKKVDELAETHGYNRIWKSSYFHVGVDNDSLNLLAAEEIVNLVQALIVGKI